MSASEHSNYVCVKAPRQFSRCEDDVRFKLTSATRAGWAQITTTATPTSGRGLCFLVDVPSVTAANAKCGLLRGLRTLAQKSSIYIVVLGRHVADCNFRSRNTDECLPS